MKEKDLQPWYDFFDLLRNYVKKGLMEIKDDCQEAYITEAALYALSPENAQDESSMAKAALQTAWYISIYAGWLSMEGRSRAGKTFALHVVGNEAPHDIVCSILVTERRRWWNLWQRKQEYEIITYNDND